MLVGEDGQVENRILDVPAGLPTSALIEAANFLNARIRGRRSPKRASSSKPRWKPAGPSSIS